MPINLVFHITLYFERKVIMGRLLEIDGLHLGFSENAEVAKGISLHVDRQEILGVAGPSGAGKSITLWAVPGLLPDGCRMSGTIVFYPQDNTAPRRMITPSQARTLAGRHVAIIPQNPFTSLNPVLTCGSQITEALRFASPQPANANTAILTLLGALGFDDPQRIYDAYPFELSGGQLQRVVIAMAFAADPALIIADEPTTALDIQTQAEVLGLLHQWVRDNARSMILVSHDLQLLYAYCDRITLISDGLVIRDGPVQEMRNWMQAKELFEPGKEAYGMQDHETLCALRNVNVQYQSRSGSRIQALYNVSFTMYRQEILGLVGATGCGKSTIAKVLTGLVPVQSGEVLFDGQALDYDRDPKLRSQVQLIFQDPYSALYPHLPVEAYLLEAIRHHRLVGRKEEQAVVARALDQTGLPIAYRERYPHQLSGGERQRVQIARALLVQPTLLICDEITSGLDAAIQGQILQLLLQIHRDTGMAMLVITHDLRVVRLLASRVLVMDHGEIIESGSVEKVFSQPDHEITRALLQAQPAQLPQG